MIDRRIKASDKELKAPSNPRYPAQMGPTGSLGPSATCPSPLMAPRAGHAGRARLRYTRWMTRGWRRPLGRVVGPVLAAALLVGGCSGDGQQAEPTPSRSTSPATSASPGPSAPERSLAASPQAPASTAVTPTADAGGAPEVAVSGPPPSRGPVRLERWFDRELSGGGLRLGAERERTSAYRSYDVSYRSQDLRISGVINVPRGRGPFPAVVLAHGYIDPAIYVRGQGMPRERRSLASAGYIALHVDYRNHAASDDDPALQRTARLGYSVDVLNAVLALRATDAVPVDDDRIALMGRSMGGGVVYRALRDGARAGGRRRGVRLGLLRRGGQLRPVLRALPVLGVRRAALGHPWTTTRRSGTGSRPTSTSTASPSRCSCITAPRTPPARPAGRGTPPARWSGPGSTSPCGGTRARGTRSATPPSTGRCAAPSRSSSAT